MNPIASDCPFWEKKVTLARVDLASGTIDFYHTIEWKMMTLAAFRDGCVYFVAWPGQWTTDLFLVRKEDAVRLIAEKEATYKKKKP